MKEFKKRLADTAICIFYIPRGIGRERESERKVGLCHMRGCTKHKTKKRLEIYNKDILEGWMDV